MGAQDDWAAAQAHCLFNGKVRAAVENLRDAVEVHGEFLRESNRAEDMKWFLGAVEDAIFDIDDQWYGPSPKVEK